MDDTFVVCCFESIGYLKSYLQRLFNWDGSTLKAIRQRVAFNKFKYEEVSPTVFLETVNRSNVGVVQRCKQLCLTFKSCQTISVLSELFRQRLDRYFTPEFRITRTPYFSHATLTEEAEDLVMAEFGAGFHVERRFVPSRKVF